MRVSFLFTLTLPLLGVLARPLPRGQSDSFDLDLRTDSLDVDALDLRALRLREYVEELLEARAKGRGPAPKAAAQPKGSRPNTTPRKTPPQRQSQPPKSKGKAGPRPPVAAAPPKPPSRKITAAQQAQRKAEVKAKVATAHNRKAATQLPFSSVRPVKQPKPNQKKGSSPTAGQKANMKASAQLPFAPRLPKNVRTQLAADERQRARKEAGRAKYADAKAAHRATTNLPNRKNIYNVNEKIDGKVQTVKYTGADVRRAVFNSHLHKNNPVNFQPKTFENRLQGPKDNKKKPIPYMNGKGKEFPLSKNPGGYQGERPGAARVVTQRTNTGYKFQGVVAHNPALGPNHPGHNDHFLVKKAKK